MPAKQTVDYQCNGCHTTAFNAKKDDQGKYSFSLVEGGIGCEQCHGPGSKHVAAQGDGGILNPRKMGTWQQEQLCGQCHIRVTSKQDKDFAFPLGFKTGQTDLQDKVEFWTYSTKPANFWGNEDAKKNRQQHHDTMRSGHMAAGITCVAPAFLVDGGGGPSRGATTITQRWITHLLGNAKRRTFREPIGLQPQGISL